MSMEMHVFYRGKLPTKTALNRAMKELGLPLTITEAARPLEQQTGFMPMRWRREETGVEFDVWSDPQSIREIGAEGVDPSFDRTANFRWGGDYTELLAAQSVAAAIVKLTGAVVFDPQDGRVLSYEEVVGGARDTLQQLKADEKPKVRTARQADLKHHLKPLLKARSDLVLRGHRLIMTPVRHLLRGAWFDRTSNKYTLKVARFIVPLYDAVSYFDEVTYMHVWEPYFQPLLLDLLQEQVFEHVGQVTDISSYARYLADRRSEPYKMTSSGYDPKSRVTAHLLAGERDLAEDVVKYEENERKWGRHTLEETRTFLGRDIESFCAHHRAHEARWCETTTLKDFWQPAPFPAELPIAEQGKVAEVAFEPKPWSSLPDGFFESAPDRPGDVAFARACHWRKNQMYLVAPLTREQAEAMHHNQETYCLATRLANGALLRVERRTPWNSYDPTWTKQPSRKLTEDYWISVHGLSHTLNAMFSERHKDGALSLESLSLSGPETSWSARIFLHTNTEWRPSIEIVEYETNELSARKGENSRKNLSITNRTLNAIQGRLPEFGEYECLLGLANRSSNFFGYGDVVENGIP